MEAIFLPNHLIKILLSKPVDKALGTKMMSTDLAFPHVAMDVVGTAPTHFEVAKIAGIGILIHVICHVLSPFLLFVKLFF